MPGIPPPASATKALKGNCATAMRLQSGTTSELLRNTVTAP
nr:MAG TPA: hypothetical protein [Caudoviricetes sp.]